MRYGPAVLASAAVEARMVAYGSRDDDDLHRGSLVASPWWHR